MTSTNPLFEDRVLEDRQSIKQATKYKCCTKVPTFSTDLILAKGCLPSMTRSHCISTVHCALFQLCAAQARVCRSAASGSGSGRRTASLRCGPWSTRSSSPRQARPGPLTGTRSWPVDKSSETAAAAAAPRVALLSTRGAVPCSRHAVASFHPPLFAIAVRRRF